MNFSCLLFLFTFIIFFNSKQKGKFFKRGFSSSKLNVTFEISLKLSLSFTYFLSYSLYKISFICSGANKILYSFKLFICQLKGFSIADKIIDFPFYK